MKRLYSFLFLMVLLCVKNSTAQNDCSTPYSIVTGTSYTFTALTATFNPDLTNDYGCIASTQANVTWLYLGICTGGSLDIEISTTAASSMDVDFIAWGPLTAATTCGLTAPQIVDCSNSTSTTETINIPAALPGEFYKIMISNFSGTPGTFSVNQTGGTGVACTSTVFGCPGTVVPQPICQITTDPVINKNIIIWEKDTVYTGPYMIQKESTAMGVYNTIATVMNNDTSAYTDSISNPMIQAFRYRIATTDSCGLGTVAYGAAHQTIHLLTSASSSTGYPQLSWNPYAGFGYGTYYIYRGASPSALALYDSISASFISYTDVMPAAGINYYGVSVFPPTPCQPSRSMMAPSLSNISPVTFTGITEFEFANLSVGPNPANTILNFSLGNINADIRIDILDVTGRMVFSEKFTGVSSDAIDLSDISNGSYIVRFTSENKTTHRNIVVVK
jgi:type IX secretion system substrate protein